MNTAPEFDVEVLVRQSDVLAARRLQALRYIDAGFVDDVGLDGAIDDPWVASSTYFGAVNALGEILGVSRLIPWDDWSGLPVFNEFEIDLEELKRFRALGSETAVEVSALAVTRGPGSRGGRVAAALYRAMSQYSLLVDHRVNWYAALDSRVLKQLVRTHGFNFRPMGPARLYLGSLTVPVRLNLFEQARHFAKNSPSGNDYFAGGIEFDLTGPEAVVRWSTGEFIPRRRRAGVALTVVGSATS